VTRDRKPKDASYRRVRMIFFGARRRDARNGKTYEYLVTRALDSHHQDYVSLPRHCQRARAASGNSPTESHISNREQTRASRYSPTQAHRRPRC